MHTVICLGKFYYCVISGTRGVVTDQYLDLSQAELIAVIVDKEMVCVCDGTLCCMFVCVAVVTEGVT